MKIIFKFFKTNILFILFHFLVYLKIPFKKPGMPRLIITFQSKQRIGNERQVYLRQQNISKQFETHPTYQTEICTIGTSRLTNPPKQGNLRVYLAKLWRYAEFMDTIQKYDMKYWEIWYESSIPYNPIFKIKCITPNLQESVFQSKSKICAFYKFSNVFWRHF